MFLLRSLRLKFGRTAPLLIFDPFGVQKSPIDPLLQQQQGEVVGAVVVRVLCTVDAQLSPLWGAVADRSNRRTALPPLSATSQQTAMSSGPAHTTKIDMHAAAGMALHLGGETTAAAAGSSSGASCTFPFLHPSRMQSRGLAPPVSAEGAAAADAGADLFLCLEYPGFVSSVEKAVASVHGEEHIRKVGAHPHRGRPDRWADGAQVQIQMQR